MAKNTSLLVAAALIVCLLAACRVNADSAFVLVHKSVDLKRVKQGSERLTVSIALHNAGSTTAYDVSLIDDSWPSSIFNILSGNTSTAWEKLDVGKSVYHTFVLEPKTKILFHNAPAVVKYRMAAKSALQEALSTPMEPLDILSDKPSTMKYDFLKELVYKYGPLVFVLSIIGLAAYLLITPSGPKKSKGSKKRK